MHTLARKQKPSHQAAPNGAKAHGRRLLVRDHGIHSVLGLAHTIGDQATQRQPENSAESPESRRGPSTTGHLAFDFSRIPVHSRTLATTHTRSATRAESNDAVAPLSSGAPLDADVRARYEPGLGTNLADVRIHTDARAAAAAAALDAEAYTAGRDIVFGARRYQPRSLKGERLLAHELAHVVQQRTSTLAGPLLVVSRPSDPAEREADRAAVALLAGRRAHLAPGSEPFAIHRQANSRSAGASGAEAEGLIRRWLEGHQLAPPEQQPDEGEQHVLLNGEDMPVSKAAQLAAGALQQPAEVVRGVIVATLARPRPFPGTLRGAAIIGPGNSAPGIPSPLLELTPTGGVSPVIGKMVDLETIDQWLDTHGFSPPEIRDPLGDRVVLDGRDTTIEEVADRAWAIAGGRVSFLTRQDVLVHLRQKYVAARGGPGTQIVFGYTLVPSILQAVTPAPDRYNPLGNQHQFSFTITRAHHAGDSPGRETSFQGSVTFDDSGNLVNLQAGGQEAVVAPLLRGWIQVSAFVQIMASANWSRSASGSAAISPAIQAAAGGQVLVTPNFREGPADRTRADRLPSRQIQ